jgi:hypothetical protein
MIDTRTVPDEDEDERLLRELRVDQPGVDEAVTLQTEKRKRSWAKIPHHQGIEIAKRAKSPVLAVLLALDHAVFKSGHNPTSLTNEMLAQYGIQRRSKTRALRQLEGWGVVAVAWKGKEAPMVRHNWLPLR